MKPEEGGVLEIKKDRVSMIKNSQLCQVLLRGVLLGVNKEASPMAS